MFVSGNKYTSVTIEFSIYLPAIKTINATFQQQSLFVCVNLIPNFDTQFCEGNYSEFGLLGIWIP